MHDTASDAAKASYSSLFLLPLIDCAAMKIRTSLTALLMLTVCILPIAAEGQTRKRKARQRPPKTNPSKSVETPCGARVAYDEFLADIEVEWRPFATSQGQEYLYNTRKVLCDKDGALKFWVKVVNKDVGEKAPFKMLRYEVKCRESQLRIVTVVEYDVEGAVIRSDTDKSVEWRDAIPNSTGEAALERVCFKR